MFALQRDRRHVPIDDFPEQLAELLAYLGGTLPEAHPFARLTSLPGAPESPDPWLLGSSQQSAIWAAELGLPYAFADFINPEGAGLTAQYRRDFVPSRWRAAPEVIVAVWVVCAESDREARQLAASAVMSFRMLQRGRLIPVPPVERAVRFLEEESAQGADRASVRSRRRVVGSPATVRLGVEAVAAEYQADEVMIVTITYDHAARCRSYELIAEEFGLDRVQAVSSSSSQGDR
jgi:luciferase family oxidoreductase group 1